MRTGATEILPLTSLRFFAAAMVVALHLDHVHDWTWLRYTPALRVHGVSFFFVLSGFILTYVYADREMRPGAFFRARFARLWPVHAATLLILVLFVPGESVTWDADGFFGKYVTLVSNLTLTHSLFPFTAYHFSWNAVSWSISTEFFFYLAFPLLLRGLAGSWSWKLLGAFALALSMVFLGDLLELPADSPDVTVATVASLTYASPLARGFEFCLGMAAWVAWDRVRRAGERPDAFHTAVQALSLSLLVFWFAAGYFLVLPTLPPYVQHLMPVAGSSWVFAVLIVTVASGRGMLARLLSVAPLVWLGKISFSMYMIHQIIIKIFSAHFAELADTFSLLLSIVVASAALHHLVEKPAQRMLLRVDGATLRSSWVLNSVFGASIVAMLAVGAIRAGPLASATPLYRHAGSELEFSIDEDALYVLGRCADPRLHGIIVVHFLLEDGSFLNDDFGFLDNSAPYRAGTCLARRTIPPGAVAGIRIGQMAAAGEDAARVVWLESIPLRGDAGSRASERR